MVVFWNFSSSALPTIPLYESVQIELMGCRDHMETVSVGHRLLIRLAWMMMIVRLSYLFRYGLTECTSQQKENTENFNMNKIDAVLSSY